MWNDLCAEQMKYRHTFLGKAFLVAPLLTLLLGIKLSPAYVVLTSFNWWYMFLLPAMLSIVSCSCGEKDRKLGEKAVFTLPVSLKRVRLIKIFIAVCGCFWLHSTVYFDVCGRTGIPGKIFRHHYDFSCAVCRSVTVSDIRMADSTLPSSGAEMRNCSHNFDQYGSKYYLEC